MATSEEMKVALDWLLERGAPSGGFPPSVIDLIRLIATARARGGGSALKVTTLKAGGMGHPSMVTRDVQLVEIDGVELKNVSNVNIGVAHAELGMAEITFRPGAIDMRTEEWPGTPS